MSGKHLLIKLKKTHIYIYLLSFEKNFETCIYMSAILKELNLIYIIYNKLFD